MLTTDHQHNHCYLQLSICQNIVVLDGLSKAPNLLRKDGDSKIVPFNIEVIFGRRPSIALFFVFFKNQNNFFGGHHPNSSGGGAVDSDRGGNGRMYYRAGSPSPKPATKYPNTKVAPPHTISPYITPSPHQNQFYCFENLKSPRKSSRFATSESAIIALFVFEI